MAIDVAIYMDASFTNELQSRGTFGELWHAAFRNDNSRAGLTLASEASAPEVRLATAIAGFAPFSWLSIRLDKERASEEKGAVLDEAVALAAALPGDIAVTLNEETPAFRRIDGRTQLVRGVKDFWSEVPWDRLGQTEVVDVLEPNE